jgi:hypothetical protein
VKRTIAILALCLPGAFASAQIVVMSCAVEETGAGHAHRTLEISFDQQNQLAYVSNKPATAAITDASIQFRIDLGAGVPFSFAIDRKTGNIVVSSDVRVLYNGVCRAPASAPHPT